MLNKMLFFYIGLIINILRGCHKIKKLSNFCLITFLILSLIFAGGITGPKKSEAFIITGTIAVGIVVAGLISGAAMQTAINYYKYDGWPETDDEWDAWWLDFAEGTMKGGIFAIAGTCVAAGGSAIAAGHIPAESMSMVAIEKGLEGAVTVPPIAYDWWEAAEEVKEKQEIMLDNALQDFRDDNPTPSKEEVALWNKNPEVYFGPYIEYQTEGYEEFVLAVEELNRQLGDWLESYALPRDIYDDIALLLNGEIIETDLTGTIGTITTDDQITIKHHIDPNYTEISQSPHELGVGIIWKVYDYQSNTWVYLDQKGWMINSSIWPDKVEMISQPISGDSLLQKAGITANDNKSIYISAEWSTTVDDVTKYSANLSEYDPESGVLADTPLILSLDVVPAPSIHLNSPSPGSVFQIGQTMNINWNSTNSNYGFVKIEISRDNGSSWSTIVDSTNNDGNYSWTVDGSTSNNCLIRISSTANPNINDTSNNTFSVLAYCSGHDMAIHQVNLSRTSIKPSGVIDFEVCVKNNGAVNEDNVSVELNITGPGVYQNGKTSDPKTIPPLQSGNISDYVTLRFDPGTSLWPSITENGSYTATIEVKRSEECDEDYSDNQVSYSIYVSESGSSPPNYAYKVKIYYFSQYGESKTIGSDDPKTFTFKAITDDDDVDEFELEIEGEETDWYDTDVSYYANNKNIIFWCEALTKNGYYNGRLWLVAGEAVDDRNGFSDYHVTVPQGNGAIYESPWQEYDDGEVYYVYGNDSRPRISLDDDPEGSYSTDDNQVIVDTNGLDSDTYRFAILTGNPSSTSFEYLAFGRFDVEPAVYIFCLQKGGNGNGQVKVNGTLHELPWCFSDTLGTNVSLEAVHGTDSEFSSWSGDLSGVTNPTTITMNGDKDITVNFKTVYTLALSKTGSGSGQIKVNGISHSLPYNETFDADAVVDLEAVPDDGSEFVQWSGSLSGDTNPTTITMSGNKNVNADFTIVRVLTAHINSNVGGIIMADGIPLSEGETNNYNDGDTAHLIAVPAYGYEFVNWSGDASGSSTQTQITMDEDKSLTANFVELRYTLTLSSDPEIGGTITADPLPSGDGKYSAGTMVTLMPNSESGYTFSLWAGNLSGSANPAHIIMNVDKNVTANFSLAAPDIRVVPCPIDFGSVLVGSNEIITVDIYNDGDSDLVISEITISGSDITQFNLPSLPSLPINIPQDGSQSFDVGFAPTSAGDKSATVYITSNDPEENPLCCGLTGIGGSSLEITEIYPLSGPVDTQTNITGNNFGVEQGASYVTFFDGIHATNIISWSDIEIVCTVPDGAEAGCVTVTTDQGTSNCVTFTIEEACPPLPFTDDFSEPTLAGWEQLMTGLTVIWQDCADGGEVTAELEYPTQGPWLGHCISPVDVIPIHFMAKVRLEQNLPGDESDYVNIILGNEDYENFYFINYGYYIDSAHIGIRLVKRSQMIHNPDVLEVLCETTLPFDTDYHNVSATRDTSGNWRIQFDGEEVATANDIQYTQFGTISCSFNNKGGYITELKFHRF